jgi:hypothetical protein
MLNVSHKEDEVHGIFVLAALLASAGVWRKAKRFDSSRLLFNINIG